MGKAVRDHCPSVEHLVQFTPNPEPGDIIDGAVSITDMMAKGKLIGLKIKNIFTRSLEKAYAKVDTKTYDYKELSNEILINTGDMYFRNNIYGNDKDENK